MDKWFPLPAKNETILPVHVVRMKLDLNNNFTRQYIPEDNSEHHPQESYNTPISQVKEVEASESAAPERAAPLEKQLSNIQVI
jgi:hypothetical protein